MISTLVGACIVSIAALVAVWLQVAHRREARGRKELHLEDFSKRLAEIDVRLRDGKLKESEADAARIALLDQLRAAGQWRRFITSGLSLRNSALALVAMAGLALAAFTVSTYDAGEPASGVGAQPKPLRLRCPLRNRTLLPLHCSRLIRGPWAMLPHACRGQPRCCPTSTR